MKSKSVINGQQEQIEQLKKDIVRTFPDFNYDGATVIQRVIATELLKNFHEPVREGIPKKGEVIGMHRDKFHCALLHVYDFSDNELASIVGTKVTTLRHWRTEKRFKEVVHCAVIAIAFKLRDSFASYVAENEKLFSAFLKETPVDKLANAIPPRLTSPEFRDVPFCSPLFLGLAVGLLEECGIAVLSEFLTLLNDADSPFYQKTLFSMGATLLDNLTKSLEKGSLTEDDRKLFVYILPMVSKHLSEQADKIQVKQKKSLAHILDEGKN